MKKRKVLSLFVLTIVAIAAFLTGVFAALLLGDSWLALTIPVIYRGSTNGMLYEEDDLMEKFADEVSIYSDMLGLEFSLPQTLDEAVLVLDDNDTYHCLFYYPFNSQTLTYYTSDGRTIEYRDGWIFTPDYQLYDYNTNGGRERLLNDSESSSERTPAGLIVYLDWPKSSIVYPESIQKGLQKKWPMELKIFALEHDIDNQTLKRTLEIAEDVVSSFVGITTCLGIVIVAISLFRFNSIRVKV